MEPGSDPVTTDKWTSTVITVNQSKEAIDSLVSDIDNQIFAVNGVPETYFKPKGSTDRLISEQDKTFIARLKIPQSILAEQIEEKLIMPKINYHIQKKEEMREFISGKDPVEEILKSENSWLKDEPKYPKVVWKSIFKEDQTQTIANAIALLNSGIIDLNRAATMVGEIPIDEQLSHDVNKISIDKPLDRNSEYPPEIKGESSIIPEDKMKLQQNMELLRGSNNVINQKDDAHRNIHEVKDSSQLGGGKYEKTQLSGDKGDLSQKHIGLK
jgi:hypothetical protein